MNLFQNILNKKIPKEVIRGDVYSISFINTKFNWYTNKVISHLASIGANDMAFTTGKGDYVTVKVLNKDVSQFVNDKTGLNPELTKLLNSIESKLTQDGCEWEMVDASLSISFIPFWMGSFEGQRVQKDGFYFTFHKFMIPSANTLILIESLIPKKLGRDALDDVIQIIDSIVVNK